MIFPRTVKDCRQLGMITAYEAAEKYPVSRYWVYKYCHWHGPAMHRAFFDPAEIEKKLMERRIG